MSKVTQTCQFAKNKLYREHYRRTIKGVVVLAMTAVALTLVLTYLSVSKEQPDYYATTTTGELIPLHSLSQPVITNKTLLQWASLAARSAFNLDFVHSSAQLKTASANFTSAGWEQFLKAMAESHMISDVTDKKLQMSAVVSQAPVILNQAIVSGRYTWRVQMPLLVTYVSASETRQQHLLVTMDIQRVPVLSAAKGILISDFYTNVDS